VTASVQRAGRVFELDVVNTLTAERRRRGERLLRLLENAVDHGFEIWLRDPNTGTRERVHLL